MSLKTLQSTATGYSNRKQILSTTGKLLTFSLLALAICTGCLREPFHGQTYNKRSDAINFWGAMSSSGQYIEIEVRNPKTGHWDYLTSTSTQRTPYSLPTGTWYIFDTQKQIPFGYWVKKAGNFSCRLRAVSQHGAMLTMDASWEDTANLSINGPLAELAEKHLHGQEVTIIAKQ